MKQYLIIVFFSSLILPLKAQQDSVWKKNLNEITIRAERVQVFNTGSRTDKPDSLIQLFLRSSSIGSLLDASGGMVVRSYGPGILATSTIRGGSSQQTALTWNGMSINNPVNGLSDFNLIPAFLFDVVSVLPGLTGSLQGSGAVSGGITLNNTIPIRKGFSAEMLQSAASFGTYNGGIKTIFSFNNKWSHISKVYYSYARNNYPYNNAAEPGNPKEYLLNAENKTISVLHETGFRSVKAGEIKIGYWGTFAEREIPPALFARSSEARQIDHINKTMILWEKSFKKVSLKFRSLLQNDFLRYAEPEININSVSKSVFTTNDVELRFRIYKNSQSGTGVVQTFATARVANISENLTTLYNHSDRNQIALWASHFQQFPILRTRVTASIRQEMVELKRMPITPSLGFKTIIHKNFEIYGQASRVYRIPTLNDLYWFPGGNADLKPESGWSFELSSAFHKKTQRVDFSTSLTGFSRLIKNWIQWQPVSVVIWSPVNIGNTNSSGLELRNNLNLIITKKVLFKAALTFDYTRSVNAVETNSNYLKQLIYIPYLKASGFAGMEYNRTVLLLNGIWVGKRYITSDNTDSLLPYFVLNLTVSQNWNFKKTKMNMYTKINNILNKRYEAIVFRPMPGINFELGILIALNP